MQATVNPDAKFPNLETIVARVELTDAANGLWVTPTQRDWKDTEGMSLAPRKDGASRIDLLPRQVFAGLLDRVNPSTNGKSRDWPSPNKQDGDAGHQMPTDASPTGRRADGTKCSVTLPGVMVKTEGRGVLNSRWVLQLQGYPSDWLNTWW